MVLGSLFRTRCAWFPNLLAFPPRFQRPVPLRRLFETVLQRCIDEGLVGGEDFAIDASLIQADASDRSRVEGAADLPPEAAGRAVAEYLAVLNDAEFGAASAVTPKFIAPADPATRWTAAHRGPTFFTYSNNLSYDVDNAIIVDVEATTVSCRGRGHDHRQQRDIGRRNATTPSSSSHLSLLPRRTTERA
jgi:hypothetical protein